LVQLRIAPQNPKTPFYYHYINIKEIINYLIILQTDDSLPSQQEFYYCILTLFLIYFQKVRLAFL